MTDPARNVAANSQLTELLRARCGDDRIRVMRIRWDDQCGVEVEIQLDINPSSFRSLGTISVSLDPALGIAPPRSCLDDDVVDAVAGEFPCEILRSRVLAGDADEVPDR